MKKEKYEELKKELTALQSQLSEIQGFTDKQKSFCSLGLTKKPNMLFVILKYAKIDLNARLSKNSFKMPLKSKLKTPALPLQTL